MQKLHVFNGPDLFQLEPLSNKNQNDSNSQTQIHSTIGSPSFDVFTVSKPPRTTDHCPRLRIKYQGEIRTNKDASIQ